MKTYLAMATIALVGLTTTASAAVIDDFESYSDDQQIVGSNTTPVNGWYSDSEPARQIEAAVDPTDASNMTMNLGDNSDGTFWKSATIGANDTLTLTFGFLLVNADPDVSLCMMEAASTTDGGNANDAGPQIRIVDNQVEARDDSSFKDVATGLNINTWYTIEMVIDNANNVWSGTINGAALKDDTDDDTFAFRNTGTGDLINFAGRFNNDNSGQALLNDIAIVPEPATMGLLGLGGLAMLRRRRRA